MDINKNLIEYGKLSIKLDEINQSIYEIIYIYKAYSEEVQLFRYFDFNKKYDGGFSLNQWAVSENETIDDCSYDLLKFIKEKKKIKQKMNYRNRNIIKYGIELYRENKTC